MAELILMTDNKDYQDLHYKFKAKDLSGRYITNEHIKPLIKNLNLVKSSVIGYSVNNLLIYSLEIGNGPKKILMWSQMHGNESTTTKAIFDLLNILESGHLKHILENCTLCIIPILNPDGALAYTRVNANRIDLNRDAQNLSQPESSVLKNVFNEFKPDFCLNLHGQRTIFSAGQSNHSATVSFLAPAQDEERSITNNRKRAMELIVVMNSKLQEVIYKQVGIYDDSFNINCVGDTFQSLDVPTVLFEAGHIDGDYHREEVRGYICIALLTCIDYISTNEVTGKNYKPYIDIPENDKLFYDIIIRNAKINLESKELQDIAIQYQEVLKGDRVDFIPVIVKLKALDGFFAHRTIDAQGNDVTTSDKNHIVFELKKGLDVIYIKGEKLSLKPMINE